MLKSGALVFIILFLLTPLHSQSGFFEALADSALTLTYDHVIYDPAYRAIDYPNGDVAPDRGVCSDVVIRAYRKVGIDLQKEVHEDMLSHFALYPQFWGLSGPDKNIDHRRVPNLMTFFARKGEVLSISKNARDYRPGDVVSWDLGGGITHIGLISGIRSKDGQRYQVVHNIGSGQVLEDVLFRYQIIGHHRYR